MLHKKTYLLALALVACSPEQVEQTSKTTTKSKVASERSSTSVSTPTKVAKIPLNAESVFTLEMVDENWKKMYAEIKGDTDEQKSANAMTNWEMKAVAQMDLFLKSKSLREAGLNLHASLDEEGKKLLLQTHKGWREYISLQANFMTYDSRGGSGRSLFVRSVLQQEMELRTQLYRDLLEGKSLVKENFYIYK